jgi:hypothetical protein
VENLKSQQKFLVDAEGMCQEPLRVLLLEIKVFSLSKTLQNLRGYSVPLVTVGQQLLV